MKNVIEFLNNNSDYNFQQQIDISIRTCVSDPQNSILKSYKILEHIIDEVYFCFSKLKKSDDMFKLINDLSLDIDDDIRSDMHSIRIIRNKASHYKETSYIGTIGSEVDFSEAIYVLKKIYDLLGWFVNLDHDPIIMFPPFQDMLDEILDKSIEKKIISKENNETINNSLKIGDFIQTRIFDFLEKEITSDNEISELSSHEYSFNIFGLKHPFISKERNGKTKSRYYSKPIKILGKRYYVCNAWNDNNKQLLFKWCESKNIKLI